MPRHVLSLAALLLLAALVLTFAGSSRQAAAELFGVSEVSSSAPSFGPGQALTITVVATDDDGTLTITSSATGSKLTVTNCSGIGPQVSGRCDGTGMSAVSGQGTKNVTINTATLDSDIEQEAELTITLTLTASCTASTAVTISADQPENAGPDDVTVNCIPPTPTPTPTLTPSPTPTQTPMPTSTPLPPIPTPTLITQVQSSVAIQPPSTGGAGLK